MSKYLYRFPSVDVYVNQRENDKKKKEREQSINDDL